MREDEVEQALNDRRLDARVKAASSNSASTSQLDQFLRSAET